MRRPVSEEEKEKADLRAMDEELVANLVRGRFLSGIIVDESEKDADSKAENPDGNTEDGTSKNPKNQKQKKNSQRKKNNNPCSICQQSERRDVSGYLHRRIRASEV